MMSRLNILNLFCFVIYCIAKLHYYIMVSWVSCLSPTLSPQSDPTCLCVSVIRAKVVGESEVNSGNDIYGNPIKRIQYEIKQIKVRIWVFFLIEHPPDAWAQRFSDEHCVTVPDVQGAEPGHRGRLHRSCVRSLRSYPGCHWQEGVLDFRSVAALIYSFCSLSAARVSILEWSCLKMWRCQVNGSHFSAHY